MGKIIDGNLTINDNFVIGYGRELKLFDILTGEFNEEISKKLNDKITNGSQLSISNQLLYGNYLLSELYGIIDNQFITRIKIINIKSLDVLDLEMPDKNLKINLLKVDSENNIAVWVDKGAIETLTAISLKTGRIIKRIETNRSFTLNNYEFSEDGSLLTSLGLSVDIIDFDNFKFIQSISDLAMNQIVTKGNIFVDKQGIFISADGNTILAASFGGYDVITINNAVKKLRNKL